MVSACGKAWSGLVLAALLGGCASVTPAPVVLVETAARGQPLVGAACTAVIGDLRWDVTTPSTIVVGNASGTLRIVCNMDGFRTSELIFRPASYGSAYPRRLVLDMNKP